jgi:hypothetical protein
LSLLSRQSDRAMRPSELAQNAVSGRTWRGGLLPGCLLASAGWLLHWVLSSSPALSDIAGSYTWDCLLLVAPLGVCYFPLIALAPGLTVSEACQLSKKASRLNGESLIVIFVAALSLAADGFARAAPAGAIVSAAILVFIGVFNYVAYLDIFERRQEYAPERVFASQPRRATRPAKPQPADGPRPPATPRPPRGPWMDRSRGVRLGVNWEASTMVMNLQWTDWYDLGLVGFPISVICYEQMLACHHRPTDRTFIALDYKAHMVILYGFAAVSAFALACFSLWRIVWRVRRAKLMVRRPGTLAIIAAMAIPARSGAEAKPSEWTSRSAIVYISDPVAELPLEHGVRPDLPQLATSPLVEPSFFTDLHTILLGRTLKEYIEDFKDGRVNASAAIRSVAHATPIPREYSIALYVCSDELCKLLAATDEKRLHEITHRWRGMLWPKAQPYEPEPENRLQHRAAILSQLVALAQAALRSDRKLMVRLEYRRRRKDPDTGEVREPQATRH